MTPFATELSRQLLRWFGLYLVTIGLPEETLRPLLEDPQAVSFVAGIISYGLAEAGWLLSRLRRWWKGEPVA